MTSIPTSTSAAPITDQTLLDVAPPLEHVAIQPRPEGHWELGFHAGAGLYQLTVEADGSAFDWDSLYVDLWRFGNKGERTGPWDFDIGSDGNVPLVPAYRTWFDGQYLGVWNFSRISPAELRTRRLSGRMAFYVEAARPHRLRFEPIRPCAMHFDMVHLEPDPEDRLLDPAELPAPLDGWMMRRWRDSAYWSKLRELLKSTHQHYLPPLSRAAEWVMSGSAITAEDAPLLIAAERLGLHPGGIERALPLLDGAVAQEHWGNPNPDGYGCDGDFAALRVMRALAWTLHACTEGELGRERRAAMVEKLRLQGQHFFHGMLITRDYWGGSLLQDHGWKSALGFASFSLMMLGEVEEAGLWCRYALPRAARSIAILPRDGVISFSNKYAPWLLVDPVTEYRRTLLAATGEDLFDNPRLRAVAEYLKITRHPEGVVTQVPGQGDQPTMAWGVTPFLEAMAARTGDAELAHLARLLLSEKEFQPHKSSQWRHLHHGTLWGFFEHDPGVAPQAPAVPERRLVHFDDSGLVHYRDRIADVTFALRCGPVGGHDTEPKKTNRCDLAERNAGTGHFVVYRGMAPLLCTPDAGYRIRSELFSCLLIDGHGAVDTELEMPMALPGRRWHGARVDHAGFDQTTGVGRVELDLTPAYRPVSSVVSYRRRFLIEPGGMQVRDTVVCREPHQLSWLFQAAEDALALSGGTARIGGDAGLTLKPTFEGCACKVRVARTPVVWAYVSASAANAFAHVRYDTTQPVSRAVATFRVGW